MDILFILKIFKNEVKTRKPQFSDWIDQNKYLFAKIFFMVFLFCC